MKDNAGIDFKITIGNVCFIQDPNNKKILLLKRNKEPMRGLYTGVGGKTNFYEDIHTSCIREVEEETGLKVSNLRLKGIVKTILKEKNSSWILFVYFTNKISGDLKECNEGELHWVDKKNIYNKELIGFTRKLIPYILDDKDFFEATIKHDIYGNIIEKTILQSTRHTLEQAYTCVHDETHQQAQ